MKASTRVALASSFATAAAFAQDPSATGLRDGATIATTVCVACHGVDGKAPAPIFPNIGAQHSIYLSKQLEEYKSGKRQNEVMKSIMTSVQRGEIAGLATYYAQQKPASPSTEDAALVARGRQLFEGGRLEAGTPACSGCHEARAEGGERYPRLAGQSATYTAQTLAEFKAGARHNDSGRVMRNIATTLGDDDIKALSAYLAAQ